MPDLVVILLPLVGLSLRNKLNCTSKYAQSTRGSRPIIDSFFQIFLPVQVFYVASAVAIKTSLILLYYRLFSLLRWFRWELVLVWILVVLYFIVVVLVAILECKPVSYIWDESIPGGTCINRYEFYRWNGVVNLILDFMILTLTMPVIWHLQLKSRQKVSLTVVFLLGLLYVFAILSHLPPSGLPHSLANQNSV